MKPPLRLQLDTLFQRLALVWYVLFQVVVTLEQSSDIRNVIVDASGHKQVSLQLLALL